MIAGRQTHSETQLVTQSTVGVKADRCWGRANVDVSGLAYCSALQMQLHSCVLIPPSCNPQTNALINGMIYAWHF